MAEPRRSTNDAAAAMRMGKTFGPAFLVRVDIRGTGGDEPQALFWCRRTRDLGDAELACLLAAIEAK